MKNLHVRTCFAQIVSIVLSIFILSLPFSSFAIELETTSDGREEEIAVVTKPAIDAVNYSNSYAATEGIKSSYNITEVQAQKIAVTHIQSILMISDNESNGNWHWGVLISAPTAMYGMDGNVNSYYFTISESDGTDTGYIVVGAGTPYPPIIEYATSGSFYPEVASEKGIYSSDSADVSIYYNGGIEYLIGDGKTYKDVSAPGENAEVSDEAIRFTPEKDVNDFSTEWAVWEKELEHSATSSNPPTSGGAITRPDDYESSYQSKSEETISSYNLTYKQMSNFASCNHCAPTAATNIMYYWYNRNSYTYGNLRRDNDSTWNATFSRLHSLMGTNDTSWTPNANLKEAYKTYYEDAGFSPTVTFYSSASWNNMKTEIDNNFPFHMIVQGHYFYGDHSVVGVGYVDYTYGIFSHSRYIRVVDGWTSSASRFIHTSVGSSQVRMVKVRPY